MGLRHNTTILSALPLRHVGGGVATDRPLWGRADLRNSQVSEGITEDKAGIPSGASHPIAWLLPKQSGAIASRNFIFGTGTQTGAGAMGVNGEADQTGSGVVAATGQLVVSGTSPITGTGTVSGNILAAIIGDADLTGSGTLAGSLIAKGFSISGMTGSGTLALTSYATGTMAADIAPAVDLEAAGFSSYLLDTEIVETGLTLRQALKLIAAATAGKVSGGGSSTITISSAVSDEVDRIIATVDSSGNRTAITYDLE